MKNSSLIFICFILLSCQHKRNKVERKSLVTKTVAIKNSQSTQNTQSFGCSYDNDVSRLGIGLVLVPSKFEIYNDSLLESRLERYDMDHDSEKINICAKFFKPDYGIMHFVCVDSSKKAYQILINHDKIKYLPKTKAYVFKSWNEYITESYGVRRLSIGEKDSPVAHLQPLRTVPLNTSDTLAIPAGYEMFCPIEVKGDWLKVKYDCFYNDEDNKHEGEPCYNYIDQCKTPVTGWLRWKKKNKLLIDILIDI